MTRGGWQASVDVHVAVRDEVRESRRAVTRAGEQMHGLGQHGPRGVESAPKVGEDRGDRCVGRVVRIQIGDHRARIHEPFPYRRPVTAPERSPPFVIFDVHAYRPLQVVDPFANGPVRHGLAQSLAHEAGHRGPLGGGATVNRLSQFLLHSDGKDCFTHV